jgi:hypothetical protein
MCKRLAGGRRVSCVVQSSTSLTTPPAPPSEPDLPVCGLTLYDFEGHEELYNIQSGLLSENSFVILTVNLKTLRDDPAKVERGAVWWLDAISKRRDIGKTLCVMLLGTFLDAVSARPARRCVRRWHRTQTYCPRTACIESRRPGHMPAPRRRRAHAGDAVHARLCVAPAQLHGPEEIHSGLAAMQQLFDDYVHARRSLARYTHQFNASLVLDVALVAGFSSKTRDTVIRHPDGTLRLFESRSGNHGMHALTRHLFAAASLALPHLFGVSMLAPAWSVATQLLLDHALSWRLFGGRWVLQWHTFVDVAMRYFGLTDEVDVLGFAECAEQVGAIVAYYAAEGQQLMLVAGSGAGAAGAAGAAPARAPVEIDVTAAATPQSYSLKITSNLSLYTLRRDGGACSRRRRCRRCCRCCCCHCRCRCRCRSCMAELRGCCSAGFPVDDDASLALCVVHDVLQCVYLCVCAVSVEYILSVTLAEIRRAHSAGIVPFATTHALTLPDVPTSGDAGSVQVRCVHCL